MRRLLRTLPPTTRGHTVAVIGEFVGTISFLFFAFAGTQYVFPNRCFALSLRRRDVQMASQKIIPAFSSNYVQKTKDPYREGDADCLGLPQSREHLFKYEHRDYSHHTSRAKEPFRAIVYKLELRLLPSRQCLGLLQNQWGPVQSRCERCQTTRMLAYMKSAANLSR